MQVAITHKGVCLSMAAFRWLWGNIRYFYLAGKTDGYYLGRT